MRKDENGAPGRGEGGDLDKPYSDEAEDESGSDRDEVMSDADRIVSFQEALEENGHYGPIIIACPMQVDRSLIGRYVLYCWGSDEWGWLLGEITGFDSRRSNNTNFGIDFQDIHKAAWVEFPRGGYGKRTLAAANWVLFDDQD